MVCDIDRCGLLLIWIANVHIHVQCERCLCLCFLLRLDSSIIVFYFMPHTHYQELGHSCSARFLHKINAHFLSLSDKTAVRVRVHNLGVVGVCTTQLPVSSRSSKSRSK